jgi:DNA-binding cell septation regulator SpoVG
MSAIQVLAIRELTGRSGTVKAFVDIQVGGVTIRGAKIVQQPDQRAWLAMPSIKSDRGCWNNVLELSKPLRDAMTQAVLGVWEQRQDAANDAAPRTTMHRVGKPADPREAYAEKVGAGFEPDSEIPF